MKSKSMKKLKKKLRKKYGGEVFELDAIDYVFDILKEKVSKILLNEFGYEQCDLCGKFNQEEDMKNFGEDAESVCPECSPVEE